MTTIKRFLLSALVSLGLVVPVLAPTLVSAQEIKTGLCNGSNLSVGDAACDPDTAGDTAASSVDSIITTVINILSLVVGVVAVIMIIVGGLRYITSGGDSGGVTSAKNTILYAIVGLVIVALAQIIVQFVIGRATE